VYEEGIASVITVRRCLPLLFSHPPMRCVRRCLPPLQLQCVARPGSI
jgi:hypothetical protein